MTTLPKRESPSDFSTSALLDRFMPPPPPPPHPRSSRTRGPAAQLPSMMPITLSSGSRPPAPQHRPSLTPITLSSSPAQPQQRHTSSSRQQQQQQQPPPLSFTSNNTVMPPLPSVSKKRKVSDPHYDDLFGPDPDPSDDLEVIDLADTDVAPAASKPPPKNEIRLSAFQCVICMDDANNLTVTHCGHLFCNECLHSSLHIDTNKRVCPICRQKIDRPAPTTGKWGTKAKGYYPLELKLATKKSLGKRAEGS